MKSTKQTFRARHAARRLAAIIDSSEDAILAKNLNGIITDWNEGARRLFGYTAEEAIGRSVTMLIPEDRPDEEPEILTRIRRGERIEHYETIRQHKDGTRIDISLTVSPILNRKGEVIGASKIARDISDKRRTEEQKDLLLREMNHRIKNLFAISSSLVSLSARYSNSIEELIADLRGRFSALASAHSLTLVGESSSQMQDISLHSLIQKIAEPYHDKARPDPSVTISGPDWTINASEVTDFALLFYEFVTNAAKYGALSKPDGRIHIECSETEGIMCLIWSEYGVGCLSGQTVDSGFGSVLINATVERSLGGTFEQTSKDDVLELKITFPRQRGQLPSSAAHDADHSVMPIRRKL